MWWGFWCCSQWLVSQWRLLDRSSQSFLFRRSRSFYWLEGINEANLLTIEPAMDNRGAKESLPSEGFIVVDGAKDFRDELGVWVRLGPRRLFRGGIFVVEALFVMFAKGLRCILSCFFKFLFSRQKFEPFFKLRLLCSVHRGKISIASRICSRMMNRSNRHNQNTSVARIDLVDYEYDCLLLRRLIRVFSEIPTMFPPGLFWKGCHQNISNDNHEGTSL